MKVPAIQNVGNSFAPNSSSKNCCLVLGLQYLHWRRLSW